MGKELAEWIQNNLWLPLLIIGLLVGIYLIILIIGEATD